MGCTCYSFVLLLVYGMVGAGYSNSPEVRDLRKVDKTLCYVYISCIFICMFLVLLIILVVLLQNNK